MMAVVDSTIGHEWFDRVIVKYHIVKEDGVVLPTMNAVIDHPPQGKVGFYLYYFEAGLQVPLSTFFGSVIEAYKIHTCQRIPNFI